MTDIVERLRHNHLLVTYSEAADEIERLREALDQAAKTMRNVRGAIESGQVVDKDCVGVLKRRREDILELLKQRQVKVEQTTLLDDIILEKI